MISQRLLRLLATLFAGIVVSVTTTSQAQTFIENRGQWSPEARYLHAARGLDVWITNRGFTYDVRSNASSPALARGHVVQFEFLHSTVPAVQPMNKEQATFNYFVGSDSERWRSGVRSYANVTLRNLYKGIDLHFYRDPRGARYDLIVSPGSAPESIAIRITGANGVAVNEVGNLCILTSCGAIEQQGLFAYQMANGAKRRVPCSFAVDGDTLLRFQLGEFDRTRPLIIDPLLFSTYLGGSGDDEASAIAKDSSGDYYVTGSSFSHNFPITPGAYQRSNRGAPGYNAFISKLRSDGSSLVYSTYIGGSGGYFGDRGNAVAVDRAGNAYVVGQTYSMDFPTTSSAIQRHSNSTQPSYQNAFVLSLSPDGSALNYSTYLGGSNGYWGKGEAANAIALDSVGNAFVTGYTCSSDFPITAQALQRSNPSFAFFGNGANAFLAKISRTGNNLLFSTYFGGSKLEESNAIALLKDGNVCIAGVSYSSDIPSTIPAYQNPSGDADIFVARIDGDGSRLGYASRFGGTEFDRADAICSDDDGAVYIAGISQSPDIPTSSSAFQPLRSGRANAYLAKLKAEASGLEFATFVGGSDSDFATCIALEKDGKVTIGGGTSSRNVPIVQGAFQTKSNALPGKLTGFVAQFSPDARSLSYSTYFGGSGYERINGLVSGSTDEVAFCGVSTSADLPSTSASVQPTSNDTIQESPTAFVAKLQLRTRVLTALPDTVAFPEGSLCRAFDTMITIQNRGTDSVSILEITISGIDYVIVSMPTRARLGPGESASVTVRFAPQSQGPNIGTLTVRTDSPNDNLLRIPLATATLPPIAGTLRAVPVDGRYRAGDTVTVNVLSEIPTNTIRINTLEFSVVVNDNILTSTSFGTSLANATLTATPSEPGTLRFSLASLAGFELGASLASINYRVTLGDTTSVGVRIKDVVINGDASADFRRCVLALSTEDAKLDLDEACGDGAIVAALRRELPLYLGLPFPNPSSSVLSIPVVDGTAIERMQVLSFGGVLTPVTPRYSAGEITLEVSKLAAGTYWLVVHSGSDSRSTQFSVIH